MFRFLTLLMAFAGTQVQALSCPGPDPALAFQIAMDAPGTYVVLRGTVVETEGRVPLPDDRFKAHPVPARFSGQELTPDGFTQSLDTAMTVQITCAGPWCGQMPPATPIIAFAVVTDGAYVLDASPCETWVFAPDPKTEALLTACLQGGACVPGNGLN